MKCIILARSKLTANALKAWRGLFLGKSIAEQTPATEDIVFNLDEFRREGGIPAFRYLAERIERACELNRESSDYDSIVILVDVVRPLELCASRNAITWEKLISMLILTFPELQWVFGAFRGAASEGKSVFPRMQTSLLSLFRAQQTPLFDPHGLRDWIRTLTENALMDRPQLGPGESRPNYLARRHRLSIAVDDESSYAYLNAYTAYRFGYRASAVHSYTLASELLDEEAVEYARSQRPAHQKREHERFVPAILFEDLFLNFADGVKGLSHLSPDARGGGRSQLWPMVEDSLVDHRIFVTSDQRLYGDRTRHHRNREYIDKQILKKRNVRVMLKPYGGIFQLWKRAGLGLRPDGFTWPPHKSAYADHPHDHSSSGPLLWVAETLIHRAEEILRDRVCCPQHAIRGAVLATDALELLGGRTATASIQALRLKHNLEVLAECQFAGVEHHFEIDDRLDEIHRDAEHISKWFGEHRRIRASLNTEMQVLLELARVLHDYGHFDEEQMLTNRTRTIHNGLWVRQRPWRWFFWPVLRYIDFLLDSFPRFIFSLVVWIVATGVAAWLIDQTPSQAASEQLSSPGLRGAIKFSLDAFLGKTLPADLSPNSLRDVVYVIAGVAGLLHIGALISLIYTKVTRK